MKFKGVINKFFLLVFCLEISSCQWIENAGTPYLGGLNFKVPSGTPAFQQGYKDGCSTILYARGNGLYRDRYKYRYDPKMIGNPEYRFGHARGQSYCFYSIIGPNPTSSSSRAISPYGYDSTYNAGNINNAWGGMFNSNIMQSEGSNSSGLDTIFEAWGGNGTGGAFGKTPLREGGSVGQFFGQ